MQADTDNSSAAADAIDPIAEAIRECGYPVACTIVHNEARSKGEGTVVKGVPASAYLPRLRNSTVFEDAADWIVGCAHADGSTKTTITCGEKTRREILTETLTIDLDVGGHGTPSTGGGDDPFTVGAPVNPLDAKIDGYLMRHLEGATQNAVLKAVSGARRATLLDRLKVVGTLGTDKLWRRATDALSPPPEQAIPDSQTGGVENRGSGGVAQVVPVNGYKGGTSAGTSTGYQYPPIGVPPPGTSTGPHLGVPVAGSENTPRPPPGGGSGAQLAKGEDMAKMAKHAGCLTCGGTMLDAQGNPCGQDSYMDPHGEIQKRGVPPVEHTDGTKRWDDESKAWVDVMLDDCGKPGNVHLHKGWIVRDGDPRVHIPDETENTGERVH